MLPSYDESDIRQGKIRSLADCSFKSCIHIRCVFRVLSIEKAFG